MSAALDITKALIACESVTPHVGEAFDVLEGYLKPLGFRVWREVFDEAGVSTENLYARLGDSAPNLCFAGHLDVVPPGNAADWKFPPFEPTVHEGMLYGRGAEDMKGAVGAFVAAVQTYLNETAPAGKLEKGSISFLITGDEEGVAINGTKKMLQWLAAKDETIDACLVGEPTNPHMLGEMIKVGRRGSINGEITVLGKQGHVAYPHLADNPVTKLVDLLHGMQQHLLDEGSEFFPPSNLEVTTVDVNNATTNLIPATASARFNIRFNDLHSGQSLQAWAEKLCKEQLGETNYRLDCHISGESFLTRDEKLTQSLVQAVTEVTGLEPTLSTTGGTSDARFIKDICPVIEFGTTGPTAHQVNECVAVDALEQLSQVYLRFLNHYLLG